LDLHFSTGGQMVLVLAHVSFYHEFQEGFGMMPTGFGNLTQLLQHHDPGLFHCHVFIKIECSVASPVLLSLNSILPGTLPARPGLTLDFLFSLFLIGGKLQDNLGKL
jgi:hypothetical protein